MPKFKPKSILSRVLLGKSRQKEDDLDYLYAGFQRYYLSGLDSDTDKHDDDDGDRSSICSFSTTATADNLPGTGRTVDTYIYQPAGRWIERVAMRFTIASLHPARIAQHIEEGYSYLYHGFDETLNLHDAIADFCLSNSFRGRNGSTVVAGMKRLVKQTQSKSIDRSASALAALIRVSWVIAQTEIYTNVSRIEPIFKLETLVCSHPNKKWLLLLVKLARETAIAMRVPPVGQMYFDPVLRGEVEQIWPSLESAQKLRQRLIRVLEIYRLSGLESLEDTIGESCAICAEAVSTCISWASRGDAYKRILEIVYFTVIFILRSIHELTDSASIRANRHIYMVLQTIAYWIAAIFCQCLYAISGSLGFDMDLLNANISLRSLFADGDTLLSKSFRCSCDECNAPVVDTRALPRRHQGEGTPPIQRLIEAAKHRTRQLLRSFDKLESEVWGCESRANISNSQFEIDAGPIWSFSVDFFGNEWWVYWKRTLERARGVQVPETTLTAEFREARRFGLSTHDIHDMSWNHYQLRRDSRHKWGQYLRSNMDWDWDLATCMKRLFKMKKQIGGGPPRTAPTSSTAIEVAARPGGTLEISMGEAQEENLPTAVKFVYKTKTGEMRYMSFVPAGSGPGCQPDSETTSTGPSAKQILDPTVAQQDSGLRKGSFGGEQEVEVPETGAFPSDVSQPDAFEVTPVEESNDGCEWKETVYDGGYNVVRAGKTTISICSLD